MTKITYKSMLLGALLVNGFWFLIAVLTKNAAIVNPIAVYKELFLTFDKNMMANILASFYRVAISVVLSLVIGVAIGIIIKSKPKVGAILNPMVYFLYPVPKTALLPIIIVVGGLGDFSKIILIFLITVFQVIVYTNDALEAVPSPYYNPLITLGASQRQLVWHVSLPGIRPSIFSSIRISVATGFSILFFVEAYGTQIGLGYYIQDNWSKFNFLDMSVGIVWLSLLCFFIFVLIDFIEKKMIKL